MPFYKDEQALYIAFKEMFSRLQQNSSAVEAVQKSNMVFRFKCNNPRALVTFDSTKKPYEISYGPNNVKPTLDIILQADTLHQILLGSLPLKKALADKKLKVKGPVFKVLSLGVIFDESKKCYPSVLVELGYKNL